MSTAADKLALFRKYNNIALKRMRTMKNMYITVTGKILFYILHMRVSSICLRTFTEVVLTKIRCDSVLSAHIFVT